MKTLKYVKNNNENYQNLSNIGQPKKLNKNANV